MSRAVLLRDLLRERHWQTYSTFCLQYDKAARKIDSTYVGTYPSRAQLHRWQAGDLRKLPYARHCEVLEAMFPGVSAAEMFEPADRAVAVPDQRAPVDDLPTLGAEPVITFPNRNAVPRDLWDQLLDDAQERIEVLVYVGMFLTENPGLLPALKSKGAAGASIRLLFGDPTSREVARRSADEGIGKAAIGAKIRNALAFFGRLADQPGVEIRCHGTTLYNSIYRYDDRMIVNPHVFGAPAPHAPAMLLQRSSTAALFDTYTESFDRVWESAGSPKW